jgi:hypothetical protein
MGTWTFWSHEPLEDVRNPATSPKSIFFFLEIIVQKFIVRLLKYKTNIFTTQKNQ